MTSLNCKDFGYEIGDLFSTDYEYGSTHYWRLIAGERTPAPKFISLYIGLTTYIPLTRVVKIPYATEEEKLLTSMLHPELMGLLKNE